MKERTTSELIEALGDDVSRCHRELIASIDAGKRAANGDVHADYDYHARQLIRAIFAFIEAVTFSVKVKAAEYALRHRQPITDPERFLAVDVEHMLSDKGGGCRKARAHTARRQHPFCIRPPREGAWRGQTVRSVGRVVVVPQVVD